MLHNKFDQYFRDRLLDHSAKVSPSTWKLIHAGLLRHKAFHFWKWYVAGPSAVVVAVTAHIILMQGNKPVNARIAHSSHALTQPVAPLTQSATPLIQPAAPQDQPAAPLTQTVAANDSLQSGHTPGTPATSGSAPVTAGTATTTPATLAGKPDAAAAVNPVGKLHTTLGANARLTAARTDSRLSSVRTDLRLSSARTDTRSQTEAKARHPTKTHPASGSHPQRQPGSPSEAGSLASDLSSGPDGPATQTASPTTQTASPTTRPTRPTTQPTIARRAGPIAQPTIARPANRLAVTAQTPNPQSPKNLILPAAPYQPTGRWRIDGFASPEYFTFKSFGFSYGAGARATMVLKQHFTITAGLQYLKVDVTARGKNDSINSLFPGIFNNIQIPVLIGYTTGNSRFSVGVNAGAIFSLYLSAKGRLNDNAGWPSHNGITSYLGFNFATRVGNRLSLFAEPYIKCWYPQSTQDLPPQLFSTGISVGLRYDLK